ncbi:MAG: hypothetical protein A3A97_01845 [Candidatus Terrybacteria bacterium RIFCSPLOWO2_01_FULL_40_23]|uniref:Glycosyltransferase n=1 Tax=Candidatus Terrybacteria bacterium RIFCSPLOWO2_01_FULL_40_23 TaxID=1802366 RepID=A0A1G2PUA2_9BACT|nr:MAG: hypothetical protein A3A97_01845 [Candidatus Terrybacteria bacterium RIFCSPLOWO2_01_FULL_40_23]
MADALNQSKLVKIFLGGVGINAIKKQEALDFAKEVLNAANHKTVFVVTPNPEIIVEALRNPEFFNVLNNADLSLADGIGLNIVCKIFGHYNIERITGIDFVEQMLKFYKDRTLNVFLVGGEGNTAQLAAQKLKKRFALHNFRGATFGPDILHDGTFKQDYDRKEIIKELAYFFADIIVVGFGAPKQELWIKKNMSYFPSAKMMIGVGGALDVWAGSKIRAPSFIRALGFEWLWRLMTEPRRVKRIFNALIIFPVSLLRHGNKHT